MSPKRLSSSLALSVMALSCHAAPPPFTMEDPALKPVSPAVDAAVRMQGKISPGCRLLGMPLDLGAGRTEPALAVTTADACDWGAAMGPIWIVRMQPRPVLVLSDGGYSLQPAATTHHGLRDVVVSYGTAAEQASTRWVFDGARYRRQNKRVQRLGY